MRPDLLCLGKGITGGLPADVGDRRESAGCSTRSSAPTCRERTLYHGHSYSGNALAAAVALRHLELLDEWDVLANVRARSDELRALLDDRVAPLAGGARGPPARADGRRRARAAGRRPALGPAGVRRLRSSAACCSARSATSSCSCRRSPSPPTSSHRIVDALADGDRRGAPSRDRRDAGPTWADGAASTRSAPPGGGARRATSTRAGPEGELAPDGRPVVSFASNDYLGLTAAPGGGRGRARGARPLGRGLGRRPGSSSARARCTRELERALADWKGTEAAVLFPTGFAANLGVLTTFGGPGRLVVLRRAQPRVDHRRLPPRPRPTSRSTATRDLDHVDALLARRATAAARSSSPTPCSRWTATSPTVDDSPSCARATARCSCSTRPTPCSAPIPTVARRRRRAARRHAVEDARLARRLRRRRRPRYVDLLVNRARPFIFTTAPTPADTAAALAALRVVRVAPRATRCVARLRAPRRPRCGRATRRRSSRSSCGDEERALAAAAALLEQGLLVPAIRPPTVAPGTSRLRVALSAAHTDEQVDAAASPALAALDAAERDRTAHGRGRHRHRHRGRQDLGGRGSLAGAARARARGRGPQAGAVVRRPAR